MRDRQTFNVVKRSVTAAPEDLAISIDSVGRLADIILALQRCFIARLSETLADGEVSFVQFFLLSHLNSQTAPLSMSEIAEKMGNTTAAATGLIDRLERLDYVVRTVAPADRRKVLVKIRPRGAELVDRIHQDMVESLAKVMGSLSPDEQRMWLQIYEKIFAYCQTCQTESSADALLSPAATHSV